MAGTTRLKRETPRSEDYLEAIYRLAHDKGYASTLGIAEKLQVSAPSVSNMVKNLAASGYLEYEPYRGMKLTAKGETVARSVVSRHEILMDFLTIIGVDKATAYSDAEGIEHHLHPETADALEKLTTSLRKSPALLKSIREYMNED
ncbi:MAG: metal-dependent transcriptional regulator [Nitrososphaerales archaeon]